jgi:elongation factor Ts
MTTQISATMVKDLREKTGAGMMDAKNALVEAEGDMERAAEILRQKGIASAEKKLGRAAAEGVVQAFISPDGQKGVLVEVNCETDFVARGEAFQGVVSQVLQQALASSATSVEAFLQENLSTQSGVTVEAYMKENIAVIKENLGVRRFTRYTLSGPGWISAYIHTGGKIGVLLQVEAGTAAVVQQEAFKQLAKDVSMHIASAVPEYVTRDEIPANVIEEEKRIEMGKEDLQSKPVEIREKIVLGRIDKLLAQRVLLDQPFVKDPGKTVAELIKEKSAELGTPIQVKQFVRYLLGEGLEKRQDNFAEEVMAQMNR